MEKTMFEATIQETSYRTADQVNSAMLRVYNHMLMAIVTSAVVAGLVASSPAAMAFFFTGVMKWITLFLPLVAIFGVSYALANNPPHPVAVGLLHGFAGIMGISLGAIVHVYTTGSLVMAFASSAMAQAWPAKPIRIVVSFPPGAPGDLIARLIQPDLQKALGQPIFVENKPGAGGNIGAQEVSRATDGHTFLVGPDTMLSINPHLYKKLTYKPTEDLIPVTLLASFNQMLV